MRDWDVLPKFWAKDRIHWITFLNILDNNMVAKSKVFLGYPIVIQTFQKNCQVNIKIYSSTILYLQLG